MLIKITLLRIVRKLFWKTATISSIFEHYVGFTGFLELQVLVNITKSPIYPTFNMDIDRLNNKCMYSKFYYSEISPYTF